jgi:hypothetical protein
MRKKTEKNRKKQKKNRKKQKKIEKKTEKRKTITFRERGALSLKQMPPQLFGETGRGPLVLHTLGGQMNKHIQQPRP